MVAEGRALARIEGKVVFVEGATPGDVADLRIVRSKKDFSVGRVHQLISPSPHRTTPFCRHFGVCGGCNWQHIAYRAQLEYKQGIVTDAFRRIAKIAEPNVLPIIGCERERAYRNKLEFTFTDSRWLSQPEIESGERLERRGAGFHKPGAFDRVLDIEECWLQDDLHNRIRLTAKTTAIEQGLTFRNVRSHRGTLRNLIIRNTAGGQWMVVLVFGEDDADQRESYLRALMGSLPEVNSWYYVINLKGNDSISDLGAVHFHGEKHLTETIGSIRFQIGPKSFFQTNSTQLPLLLDVVTRFAELTGTEHVLDLYCGIGTIALSLAGNCAFVTGFEVIGEAVNDANENARLNEIGNAGFHALNLDKEDWTGHLMNQPDIIVLDPPRAGLNPIVIERLMGLHVPRIIYVSCNPATQARDISMLSTDYELETCQPLDMFPQTYHMENVALLNRKS